VPEVALLPKLYGATSLREFKDYVTHLCSGLKVELADLHVQEDGRVKAHLTGDDEAVAVRFLDKEVGLAPITSERIQRFSVLRGNVVFRGKSKTKVFVDIGVFAPRPVYAVVPLRRLQAQLTDGRKFALERITQLFGIVDNCPLEVRVTTMAPDAFTVELTEHQLDRYRIWVDSRLDRLLALGLLEGKAIQIIKTAGLQRDVLAVESLRALEHAIVCKLGTDAVGLLPRLGRRLPPAQFACFSPRRVLKFLHGRA
jgi:hypothetical protein